MYFHLVPRYILHRMHQRYAGSLTGSTRYRVPLHLFIKCLLFLFVAQYMCRLKKALQLYIPHFSSGSTDLKPLAARKAMVPNAFFYNKIQLVRSIKVRQMSRAE